MLDFRMAIGAEGLLVTNPMGTVALCSLWTPPEFVKKDLAARAPGLLSPDGPVALIGGLYGGGLKIMLRNLHHNPQLDTVVLFGKDFSGAGEHLRKFLSGEVELGEPHRPYLFEDGGRKELETLTIRGGSTSYRMDPLLLPRDFARPPEVIDLSHLKGEARAQGLKGFLASYRPRGGAAGPRPEPVPLPTPETRLFPSDPLAHSVSSPSILGAWAETLFRLQRFGVPRLFRNGKSRLELLNYKALVGDPQGHDPAAAALPPYNIGPSQAEEYAEELLRPTIREGFSYTYGNRLRAHFGPDCLEVAARDLALPGDSRHAFVTLWDNALDPPSGHAPCLVSLFFRKAGGLLHAAATFRSHNASKAWPLNALGIAGLARELCRMANEARGQGGPGAPSRTGGPPSPLEDGPLAPGTLTVMSLSLTLDPGDLPEVGGIIAKRQGDPYRMTKDPHGHFLISIDPGAGEIVARHHSQDQEPLSEYRGRDPQAICQAIHRDLAVSDLGHAMYLGSQLERAWRCLAQGRPYVQDKKRPGP
jgi:thymidylate synthase